MCGIAGWLGQSIDLATARQMSQAVAHRGPDGAGEWTVGGVWLAQRRLAIVDLSPAGRQPMVSPSGRYVITFNGEVYNAQELAAELAGKGFSFRGHSDTEVMLVAIEAWGIDGALQRFNGMFAFGLWDVAERTLYLARDRLGEKPLYFAENGQEIVFASELGALWHVPWLDKRVDQAALTGYFRSLCVPGTASIVRGARKLAAGTLLKWSAGRVDISAYWSVSTAARNGLSNRLPTDMEAAADELESLLVDAVRIRLRADVPYGAFLSGGLDSSLVVALMQRQGGDPARTFTIGFAERSHDESPHARAVAAYLGTNHQEQILSPAQVIDLVPQIANIYDEPFADSSSIPTVLLARFAREHVTVALSGDGGDELFGGYPRYFWAERIQRTRRRLGAPGSRIAAGLLRSLPAAWLDGLDSLVLGKRFGGANGLSDRVYRFADYLRCSPGDVYREIISAWKNPAEVMAAGASDALLADPVRHAPLGWAESMMAVDQERFLPDDVLTKMDRATMAFALEGRAPLLDHRLVEWAWRVPPELKLSPQGDLGKLVMRKVLYRHVPQALMERPKMGFGMPIGVWLRGPLKPWAEEMLQVRRLAEMGLQAERVQRVWQAHLAGENRLAEIWTVLMWVQWQEKWQATL
jgi:asparagine synthase (glutamine-hydrolysing)